MKKLTGSVILALTFLTFGDHSPGSAQLVNARVQPITVTINLSIDASGPFDPVQVSDDDLPQEISIQFATYAPNSAKIVKAASTGGRNYSATVTLNQPVSAVGLRVNPISISTFDNKGNIVPLASTRLVVIGPVAALPNPVAIRLAPPRRK
jgi:hypothetical protein